MSELEHIDEEYGDYTILHMIGRGAFGNVYKAIDRRTKKEVALKVSHTLYSLVDILCLPYQYLSLL